MNNQRDISGFILAGGKSNRMGTDKAFLMIQEEPLLKRTIRLIGPFCKTVAISGQKSGFAEFKTEMVPDLYVGCGPISGIISSLKHSATDWNFIIGVDLPFINDELVLFLISQIGQYDCIIPMHKGGVEPLIGLYNKQISPIIEEMINTGDHKLMRLLDKLNAKYIDCNSLVNKYPRLFTNINRLEDYQSI